ncbi:MAG TPA: 4-alpha-glucanotransferase [Stellaceae bacterium]|nr:4-alpha-glucanotransferase [Stellaceae bacterium]
MTAGNESLCRLAEGAGVAWRYRDITGEERQVPADTITAILAILGIAAGNAREIAESTERLERAAWDEGLPKAVTIIADDGTVPVILAVPEAGRHVEWTLRLEDGETRHGASASADLAVLESRREPRRRVVRCALPLGRVPPGYHRLSLARNGRTVETTLIAAPRRCYLPPALGEGRRAWALMAQLYGVRSSRNWGIGDFGDLAPLSRIAAGLGAAALGINPLHALFPAEPRHISPYSPSSRLFLNPLYIDVESVPDFAESTAAQALAASTDIARQLETLRAATLVDYPEVAALKARFFDALYRAFAAADLGSAPSERGLAFRRFQADGGEALERYARFTALHEHMLQEGRGFAWSVWPRPLRDAGSREVAEFAAAHRAQIELHQYLQWEADRQLGEAAAAANLPLGLYRDLAVGVDPNGAEAWSDPSLTVTGASVGAPPDAYNMQGQNWGLAPINPMALQRAGYAPFIAALRANMRHAGILRIDHVMALMHLYWVPSGAAATEGTYVAYPFTDLRRIVALESWRQRCAVIGEDLGTVPPGFREVMAEAGVLSYRLLLFERDEKGAFLSPERYPALASAAFSTHDLATLRGFWLARDLEWRRDLALYPSADAAAAEMQARRRDRQLLLAALVAAGVLTEEAAKRLLPNEDAPHFTPGLVVAVHRFLGRSPAALALMQIEDALGELEQANLPGTVDQHPNWRRKLSRTLEAMARDADIAALARAFGAARKTP